jgi:hypothetical protein
MIIYANRVEIEHVPVYTCDACRISELHHAIKDEMTELIARLGAHPDRQKVRFDELNDLAHLLRTAETEGKGNVPLETLIEERVNELLDLLLLSRSLGDTEWTQDIHRRLKQIARYSAVPQRASGN